MPPKINAKTGKKAVRVVFISKAPTGNQTVANTADKTKSTALEASLDGLAALNRGKVKPMTLHQILSLPENLQGLGLYKKDVTFIMDLMEENLSQRQEILELIETAAKRRDSSLGKKLPTLLTPKKSGNIDNKELHALIDAGKKPAYVPIDTANEQTKPLMENFLTTSQEGQIMLALLKRALSKNIEISRINALASLKNCQGEYLFSGSELLNFIENKFFIKKIDKIDFEKISQIALIKNGKSKPAVNHNCIVELLTLPPDIAKGLDVAKIHDLSRLKVNEKLLLDSNTLSDWVITHDLNAINIQKIKKRIAKGESAEKIIEYLNSIA